MNYNNIILCFLLLALYISYDNEQRSDKDELKQVKEEISAARQQVTLARKELALARAEAAKIKAAAGLTRTQTVSPVEQNVRICEQVKDR